MNNYNRDAAMDQIAEWEEEESIWSDEQPSIWSMKRSFYQEEENRDIMKKETVEKCLLIKSIPINNDIQNQIASFAFHDNHDYEFQHRKKMKHVFHDIEFAYSRKNGFNGLNKDYSNDEEWTFETMEGDVHMQAYSCHICGNYSMSNTFYLYHVIQTSHERTLCICNHDNQLVDEEEDAVDW